MFNCRHTTLSRPQTCASAHFSLSTSSSAALFIWAASAADWLAIRQQPRPDWRQLPQRPSMAVRAQTHSTSIFRRGTVWEREEKKRRRKMPWENKSPAEENTAGAPLIGGCLQRWQLSGDKWLPCWLLSYISGLKWSSFSCQSNLPMSVNFKNAGKGFFPPILTQMCG